MRFFAFAPLFPCSKRTFPALVTPVRGRRLGREGQQVYFKHMFWSLVRWQAMELGAVLGAPLRVTLGAVWWHFTTAVLQGTARAGKKFANAFFALFCIFCIFCIAFFSEKDAFFICFGDIFLMVIVVSLATNVPV